VREKEVRRGREVGGREREREGGRGRRRREEGREKEGRKGRKTEGGMYQKFISDDTHRDFRKLFT